MQNQPVMRAQPEGLRHALFQLGLDLLGRLALGEAGAVADAEDVRVDREGFLPEGAIKHDVGGLAALHEVALHRHDEEAVRGVDVRATVDTTEET